MTQDYIHQICSEIEVDLWRGLVASNKHCHACVIYIWFIGNFRSRTDLVDILMHCKYLNFTIYHMPPIQNWTMAFRIHLSLFVVLTLFIGLASCSLING